MKYPIVILLGVSLLLFAACQLVKLLHWPFVMPLFVAWVLAYVAALVLTLKMLFSLDDTEIVPRGLWFVFILIGPWWGSFIFLYVHRHDINASR